MIEPQAVVAAGSAALAEAQLAERQREVVGDDEHLAAAARARGRGPCARRCPDSFMNVSGLTSVRSRPVKRPRTTVEASRSRPRPAQPARSASRSSTIQPTLWRVSRYCSPGFPSPTTILLTTTSDAARPGRPDTARPDAHADGTGIPSRRASRRPGIGRRQPTAEPAPSCRRHPAGASASRARIAASSAGSA